MASKGFTLIEWVVLALLLGIIALVALPNFRESLPTENRSPPSQRPKKRPSSRR
jgi:type II secretory pathway pseudopilin PulG